MRFGFLDRMCRTARFGSSPFCRYRGVNEFSIGFQFAPPFYDISSFDAGNHILAVRLKHTNDVVMNKIRFQKTT